MGSLKEGWVGFNGSRCASDFARVLTTLSQDEEKEKLI